MVTSSARSHLNSLVWIALGAAVLLFSQVACRATSGECEVADKAEATDDADAAVEQENDQREVLVAARDLTRGVPVDATLVRTEKIAEKELPEGAIPRSDADDYLGAILARDLEEHS